MVVSESSEGKLHSENFMGCTVIEKELTVYDAQWLEYFLNRLMNADMKWVQTFMFCTYCEGENKSGIFPQIWADDITFL